MPNSKHYGNRSHSEADLLHTDIGYDYDNRIYMTGINPSTGTHLRHNNDTHNNKGYHQHHHNYRRHSSIGLVYPNIQVHCLDIKSNLRGISLQAKAGDLLAIMATSQNEGTLLTECLAGLRERINGEILINGQSIDRNGLRELCGYVPSLNNSSLDPRMSVQNTLSFHAALHGPIDKSDLKERVKIYCLGKL